MKRSLKVILALGLIAAAVIVALLLRADAARREKKLMGGMAMAGMEGMAPPNHKAPVTTEKIGYGAVMDQVTYTGSVVPYLDQNVYPRVEGRLSDLTVYAGDRVRAGQVMARLVAPERTSEVQAAGSELGAAKAEVDQYRASAAAAGRRRAQAQFAIDSAQQMVSQAEHELRKAEADLAYWEAEFKREQELLARGAISREEYDSEQSRYLSSLAAVEQTKARVAQVRADLSGSQAGAEAAEAELQAAQSQLRAAQARQAKAAASRRTAATFEGYTEITAPTDGVVLERLISPGVVVGPTMAVIRMADLSRVRLQANVPERDLKRLRVGTTVSARLPFEGKALQVRVTSLFPVQDATTRTGIAEAVVANPGGRLIPGQYLAMDFILASRHSVLSVPRRAVFTVNGKSMVWVVRDDKASQQPVVTGLAGPERTEIISGLKAGDEVVYAGMEGLSDGQEVTRAPWGGTEAAIKPPEDASSGKKASGKAAPGMPGM